MSRSGWTWHNLWNFLLTINFKYKYFHNSVDWSGLYLQVYIPSWLPKELKLYTVFRLLKNAFVELPHPWHDLIINPHVEQPPPPHAPLASYVGVHAPSIFARKCRLKLANILNLAKRIVWPNRSVGWGIT